METDLDSKLPPIDKSLDKNVKYIENTLGKSTDLIIRKFPFNPANDRLIAVVFIDGLCDGSVVNDYIMESLMQPEGKALAQLDKEKIDTTNVLQLIKDRALTFGDIHDLHDYNTLFHSLMSGDAILFVDGETAAIAASVRGWRDRGVSETSSENVVRGSRESFSESIRTNTALVRRRIKEPTLWMESRQIGHVSRTDVAIMYIKGLVNDQIVQEVNTRLDQIDIDSILETGYIEELIQDETMTPFPTIYNSERPDVIAAELLEGKIAIFVDGTPIVLAVPAPFVSFMHAAEDYYQRADISSFIRILRYVGLVISLLSPSFYIAVTTFHQEMIPTSLLMSLASQREYVPFPAFIEALLMELTFEILREAGVRMPKYIGAAVSIVGTLVIGQAAVQAGFISAAMVIVVSLTAISSFVLPSYNMSIAFRMLRFPLMGLAASFGLVGIFVGCTAIILHLCSLRTFGVPYMTPFGPFVPSDIKDTLLRLPHRFMITRPRLINQKNIRRQSRNSGQKPPKPR
ncbi:spore germination protein [Paenibacillus lutimineralis]|uniref:Spore germination protein n=1 Tax=Paenibacillus lutimineralis TaxID=2707005 RepID=A0A3S9V6F9_9BACL|nr:spore germination protein [Paenibacillus lutimineralis]